MTVVCYVFEIHTVYSGMLIPLYQYAAACCMLYLRTEFFLMGFFLVVYGRLDFIEEDASDSVIRRTSGLLQQCHQEKRHLAEVSQPPKCQRWTVVHSR